MNALRAVGPLPPDAGPDAVEEALEQPRRRRAPPAARLRGRRGRRPARGPAARPRGWQVEHRGGDGAARAARPRAGRPAWPARSTRRRCSPSRSRRCSTSPSCATPPVRAPWPRRSSRPGARWRPRRATRWFCGAWEGRDGCNATLYSDGRAAQVENVGTVPEPARPRPGPRDGAAWRSTPRWPTATTSCCIFADDDDWPKDLYAKLGFRTVGRVRTFLRAAAPPPGAASAG